MKVPFFSFHSELKALRPQMHRALDGVLTSGQFILGPEVETFEQEMAAYCRTPHCVGMSSGTSALELAFRAAGIGAGDEVITVPNTFMATALAISAVGATPTFVDVDGFTHNMNASQLPSAITKRTKAILPVHLYGQPADMPAIQAVAKKHRLLVVEDACQAHGATVGGRQAGTLGDLGCFSFYPTKNLGAFGDGGAVVTANKHYADRLRSFRDYGRVGKYEHHEKGMNHRLDALQAAFLRLRLKRLNADNAKRRVIVKRYREGLRHTPYIFQYTPSHITPVHHLCVIRTPKRTELMKFLAQRGIQTLIHYPIPIHYQRAYPELKKWRGRLPVAEQLFQEVLSLPIYPTMPLSHVDYVIDQLQTFSRTSL